MCNLFCTYRLFSYLCYIKGNGAGEIKTLRKMTIQDLTKNRERIIKAIKRQSSSPVAVKEVMTKMVTWLGRREDIQSMKATAANIDKFTNMVALNWIKNDWKPGFTKNENDAWMEQRKMDNLPSSMRAN